MYQIVDQQYTLTSSYVALSTIVTVLQTRRAAKVIITPDAANGHVILIAGPNGVQLKQIAKPTAADAAQDEFRFEAQSDGDLIDVGQLQIKGTAAELANIVVVVE